MRLARAPAGMMMMMRGGGIVPLRWRYWEMVLLLLLFIFRRLASGDVFPTHVTEESSVFITSHVTVAVTSEDATISQTYNPQQSTGLEQSLDILATSTAAFTELYTPGDAKEPKKSISYRGPGRPEEDLQQRGKPTEDPQPGGKPSELPQPKGLGKPLEYIQHTSTVVTMATPLLEQGILQTEMMTIVYRREEVLTPNLPDLKPSILPSIKVSVMESKVTPSLPKEFHKTVGNVPLGSEQVTAESYNDQIITLTSDIVETIMQLRTESVSIDVLESSKVNGASGSLDIDSYVSNIASTIWTTETISFEDNVMPTPLSPSTIMINQKYSSLPTPTPPILQSLPANNSGQLSNTDWITSEIFQTLTTTLLPPSQTDEESEVITFVDNIIPTSLVPSTRMRNQKYSSVPTPAILQSLQASNRGQLSDTEWITSDIIQTLTTTLLPPSQTDEETEAISLVDNIMPASLVPSARMSYQEYSSLSIPTILQSLQASNREQLSDIEWITSDILQTLTTTLLPLQTDTETDTISLVDNVMPASLVPSAIMSNQEYSLHSTPTILQSLPASNRGQLSDAEWITSEVFQTLTTTLLPPSQTYEETEIISLVDNVNPTSLVPSARMSNQEYSLFPTPVNDISETDAHSRMRRDTNPALIYQTETLYLTETLFPSMQPSDIPSQTPTASVISSATESKTSVSDCPNIGQVPDFLSKLYRKPSKCPSAKPSGASSPIHKTPDMTTEILSEIFVTTTLDILGPSELFPTPIPSFRDVVTPTVIHSTTKYVDPNVKNTAMRTSVPTEMYETTTLSSFILETSFVDSTFQTLYLTETLFPTPDLQTSSNQFHHGAESTTLLSSELPVAPLRSAIQSLPTSKREYLSDTEWITSEIFQTLTTTLLPPSQTNEEIEMISLVDNVRPTQLSPSTRMSNEKFSSLPTPTILQSLPASNRGQLSDTEWITSEILQTLTSTLLPPSQTEEETETISLVDNVIPSSLVPSARMSNQEYSLFPTPVKDFSETDVHSRMRRDTNPALMYQTETLYLTETLFPSLQPSNIPSQTATVSVISSSTESESSGPDCPNIGQNPYFLSKLLRKLTCTSTKPPPASSTVHPAPDMTTTILSDIFITTTLDVLGTSELFPTPIPSTRNVVKPTAILTSATYVISKVQNTAMRTRLPSDIYETLSSMIFETSFVDQPFSPSPELPPTNSPLQPGEESTRLLSPDLNATPVKSIIHSLTSSERGQLSDIVWITSDIYQTLTTTLLPPSQTVERISSITPSLPTSSSINQPLPSLPLCSCIGDVPSLPQQLCRSVSCQSTTTSSSEVTSHVYEFVTSTVDEVVTTTVGVLTPTTAAIPPIYTPSTTSAIDGSSILEPSELPSLIKPEISVPMTTVPSELVRTMSSFIWETSTIVEQLTSSLDEPVVPQNNTGVLLTTSLTPVLDSHLTSERSMMHSVLSSVSYKPSVTQSEIVDTFTSVIIETSIISETIGSIIEPSTPSMALTMSVGTPTLPALSSIETIILTSEIFVTDTLYDSTQSLKTIPVVTSELLETITSIIMETSIVVESSSSPTEPSTSLSKPLVNATTRYPEFSQSLASLPIPATLSSIVTLPVTSEVFVTDTVYETESIDIVKPATLDTPPFTEPVRSLHSSSTHSFQGSLFTSEIGRSSKIVPESFVTETIYLSSTIFDLSPDASQSTLLLRLSSFGSAIPSAELFETLSSVLFETSSVLEPPISPTTLLFPTSSIRSPESSPHPSPDLTKSNFPGLVTTGVESSLFSTVLVSSEYVFTETVYDSSSVDPSTTTRDQTQSVSSSSAGYIDTTETISSLILATMTIFEPVASTLEVLTPSPTLQIPISTTSLQTPPLASYSPVDASPIPTLSGSFKTPGPNKTEVVSTVDITSEIFVTESFYGSESTFESIPLASETLPLPTISASSVIILTPSELIRTMTSILYETSVVSDLVPTPEQSLAFTTVPSITATTRYPEPSPLPTSSSTSEEMDQFTSVIWDSSFVSEYMTSISTEPSSTSMSMFTATTQYPELSPTSLITRHFPLPVSSPAIPVSSSDIFETLTSVILETTFVWELFSSSVEEIITPLPPPTLSTTPSQVVETLSSVILETSFIGEPISSTHRVETPPVSTLFAPSDVFETMTSVIVETSIVSEHISSVFTSPNLPFPSKVISSGAPSEIFETMTSVILETLVVSEPGTSVFQSPTVLPHSQIISIAPSDVFETIMSTIYHTSVASPSLEVFETMSPVILKTSFVVEPFSSSHVLRTPQMSTVVAPSDDFEIITTVILETLVVSELPSSILHTSVASFSSSLEETHPVTYIKTSAAPSAVFETVSSIVLETSFILEPMTPALTDISSLPTTGPLFTATTQHSELVYTSDILPISSPIISVAPSKMFETLTSVVLETSSVMEPSSPTFGQTTPLIPSTLPQISTTTKYPDLRQSSSIEFIATTIPLPLSSHLMSGIQSDIFETITSLIMETSIILGPDISTLEPSLPSTKLKTPMTIATSQYSVLSSISGTSHIPSSPLLTIPITSEVIVTETLYESSQLYETMSSELYEIISTVILETTSILQLESTSSITTPTTTARPQLTNSSQYPEFSTFPLPVPSQPTSLSTLPFTSEIFITETLVESRSYETKSMPSEIIQTMSSIIMETSVITEPIYSTIDQTTVSPSTTVLSTFPTTMQTPGLSTYPSPEASPIPTLFTTVFVSVTPEFTGEFVTETLFVTSELYSSYPVVDQTSLIPIPQVSVDTTAVPSAEVETISSVVVQTSVIVEPVRSTSVELSPPSTITTRLISTPTTAEITSEIIVTETVVESTPVYESSLLTEQTSVLPLPSSAHQVVSATSQQPGEPSGFLTSSFLVTETQYASSFLLSSMPVDIQTSIATYVPSHIVMTSDYIETTTLMPSLPSYSYLEPSRITASLSQPTYTQTPSLDLSSVIVYTTLDLKTTTIVESLVDFTPISTRELFVTSTLEVDTSLDFATKTIVSSADMASIATEELVTSTQFFDASVLVTSEAYSDTSTLPGSTPIYTSVTGTYSVPQMLTSIVEYETSVLTSSYELETITSSGITMTEILSTKTISTLTTTPLLLSSPVQPTSMEGSVIFSTADIVLSYESVLPFTEFPVTVDVSSGAISTETKSFGIYTTIMDTLTPVAVTSQIPESLAISPTMSVAPYPSSLSTPLESTIESYLSVYTTLDVTTTTSFVETTSFSSKSDAISTEILSSVPISTTSISQGIPPPVSIDVTTVGTIVQLSTPIFMSSILITSFVERPESTEAFGSSSVMYSVSSPLHSLSTFSRMDSMLSSLTSPLPTTLDSIIASSASGDIQSTEILESYSITEHFTTLISSLTAISTTESHVPILSSPSILTTADVFPSTPTPPLTSLHLSTILPSFQTSQSFESSIYKTLSQPVTPPFEESLTTVLVSVVGSPSFILPTTEASYLPSTVSYPTPSLPTLVSTKTSSGPSSVLDSSIGPPLGSTSMQEISTLLITPSSQAVTSSMSTKPLPTTTPPLRQVDPENEISMGIQVDEAEDINDSYFEDNLSNKLGIAYLDGMAILQNSRKRRSNPEKEISERDEETEWIFQRKQSDNLDGKSEEEWIFSQGSMGKPSGKSGGGVRTRRQAEEPSEEVDVPILTATRDDQNPETVTVVFYVIENDTLVLATDAVEVYSALTPEEMSAELGYAVTSVPRPMLTTPPGPTTTALAPTAAATPAPAGLAWWWYLLISLLVLVIIVLLLLLFCCWKTGWPMKSTSIVSFDKVDRSTSVELGFLRVDEAVATAAPVSVVMETALNQKLHQAAGVPTDENGEPIQKAKRKKKSKKARVAVEGHPSDEETQLFSHVDAHAAAETTTKPKHTGRSKRTVHPEGRKLPPLIQRPLVAYSETESEVVTSEQLRMMRRAGVPKSWYTTHIDKDPETLAHDIVREKKRQKRRRERRIREQLEAQKQIDTVLTATEPQEVKNPTARELQFSRSDRWKPTTQTKRRSEIPGSDDIPLVRLVAARPVEAAIPSQSTQENKNAKRKVEELVRKTGPPAPVAGPFHRNPPPPEDDATDSKERSARDERLKKQWAEERKRIDRILDDVFNLSTSGLGDPRAPQMDQSHVAPTRYDPPTMYDPGSDPTSDAHYVHRTDPRGMSGIGRLTSYDDSHLPGVTSSMHYSDQMRRPMYDTRMRRNEDADHMYQSIRNPPPALDFMSPHMIPNVWGSMYQGGPARTGGMGVAPGISYVRDAPSTVRGFHPLDTSQHLSPRLHEGPYAEPFAPIPPQSADATRIRQENESLQRLVAMQQEQLDQTLSMIGQPNSRVGRSEKRGGKETKKGRALSANGRKQRRVAPTDQSTRPLDGSSTPSAWTDDLKAEERTFQTNTSTPSRDNVITVRPRNSQREANIILDHRIEKPDSE